MAIQRLHFVVFMAAASLGFACQPPGVGTDEVGETSDEAGEDSKGESGSSSESDPSDTDTTESTTESTTETDSGDSGTVDCTENDAWESNDLPENASVVEWEDIFNVSVEVTIDACLWSDEDDWYHVSVDTLEYDVYVLQVDVVIPGTSWCPGCSGLELPDAPENAVTVEVFDAETLQLLVTQTVQDGRINVGGAGDAFSSNLLIHVFGPTPAATYSYELTVEIHGFMGEDECEC